jgi:hypothetical protein
VLQFGGAAITSDAGSLPYRELGDAVGLTDIGADARTGRIASAFYGARGAISAAFGSRRRPWAKKSLGIWEMSTNRYLVTAAAAALLALYPSLSCPAETPAEAILAFGLVGRWSTHCPPDQPPDRRDIVWEFRIARDSGPTLQETTFGPPQNIYAIFETSPYANRYWDIIDARRADAATLNLTKIETQNATHLGSGYDSTSFFGLSQSQFAFHSREMQFALKLDGGLTSTTHERLVRNGDRIRIIDQKKWGLPERVTIKDGIDVATGLTASVLGKC